MSGVTVNGLDEFTKNIDSLLKDKKEIHRKFHERAGNALERLVRSNIVASGVNDSHGHVRAWQIKHIGSGGGYAAVRPIASGTGADSPGAITNYLENGHQFRKRLKAKKGSQKVLAARAFGFYEASRGNAGKILNAEVEALKKEIVEKLN